MDTDVITIPASRFSELEEKIGKVNKKAVRHSLPSVTYKVLEVFEREEPRYRSDHPFFSMSDTVKRMYANVEYTVATVRINGFEPVATYEFAREIPSIFVWPEKEVPSELLQIDTTCEHCRVSRSRGRIFLIENVETGEYKRVGSSCVRDFIGYDPARILEQLQWMKVFEEMVGSDFDGISIRDKMSDDVHEVLALTTAMVRDRGYTSRKREEELDYTVTSTSVLVNRWMRLMENSTPRYEGWEKDFPSKVTEEDVENANKVLETVKLIENPTNAYLQNLMNISKSESLTPREFGLTVSMVAYAYREWHKDDEKVEKEDKPVSNWIGEIKEKVDIEATLKFDKLLDGAYGITTMMKFVTVDGDLVTWFASGVHDVEKDGIYKIAGTIKKLSEYKGNKETVLTRCKLVKV